MKNNLDQLQRYANLLDQGATTQAEFAQHRSRLLASLDAPSSADDPAMRLVLPVGRTGLAIAAGYLGLLSVIPIDHRFGQAAQALGTGPRRVRPHRRQPVHPPVRGGVSAHALSRSGHSSS
jgi:hypothetical protein